GALGSTSLAKFKVAAADKMSPAPAFPPMITGPILRMNPGGSGIAALLVESLPPATMTSASPRSTAATALVMACNPEAQARLTVIASARGVGHSSAISRATFGDAGGMITVPQYMASTSGGANSHPDNIAVTAVVPRAIASNSTSGPNALKKGVRL